MQTPRGRTIEKVKRALDRYNMPFANNSILVGFSGGKDSVALLHILKTIANEYNAKIHALHVNHGIRGKEADRDEAFCLEFCQKNGIPFCIVKVDAPSFAAQKGTGLEEAARELRYNAFFETAKQNGTAIIATAHTASDNAETVLFNLIRGSSGAGMRGIPPVRGNIIRPLIYCTSDDIYDYCKDCGLDFVYDSTNGDTAYTRNNIRHNIISLAKNINPGFDNAVSNMSDSIRRDCDFIQCMASDYQDETDVHTLSNLHTALLSRIISEKHAKISDAGHQITFLQIENVSDMIKASALSCSNEPKKLCLPGNVTFGIARGKIYFTKTQEAEKAVCIEKRPLEYGLNKIAETGDALYVTDDPQLFDLSSYKNVYKKSIHIAVKKSAVTGKISIRGKKNGDTVVSNGMTKKIKKLYNQAKLDIQKRKTLPVICDKDGIIWIPGIVKRDGVTSDREYDTLHIFYLEKKETEQV